MTTYGIDGWVRQKERHGLHAAQLPPPAPTLAICIARAVRPGWHKHFGRRGV